MHKGDDTTKFNSIEMNYVDQCSKGFEKFLTALIKKARPILLQNRKWLKLWGQVPDYRYFKIKNPD